MSPRRLVQIATDSCGTDRGYLLGDPSVAIDVENAGYHRGARKPQISADRASPEWRSAGGSHLQTSVEMNCPAARDHAVDSHRGAAARESRIRLLGGQRIGKADVTARANCMREGARRNLPATKFGDVPIRSHDRNRGSGALRGATRAAVDLCFDLVVATCFDLVVTTCFDLLSLPTSTSPTATTSSARHPTSTKGNSHAATPRRELRFIDRELRRAAGGASAHRDRWDTWR